MIMCVPQKGNCTKSLAYMTLVHRILEYGAACWDPYREVQIQALDQEKKEASKYAYNRNESNWGRWAQRRKISRVCSVRSVRRRRDLGGYR